MSDAPISSFALLCRADKPAFSNTAKAPSYTLVGLFTGYKYNYHNLTVDLFGRVDNLFDKEYVGSVIVNESNGRYYEPSPGRNYGVGMNIAWRFE